MISPVVQPLATPPWTRVTPYADGPRGPAQPNTLTHYGIPAHPPTYNHHSLQRVPSTVPNNASDRPQPPWMQKHSRVIPMGLPPFDAHRSLHAAEPYHQQAVHQGLAPPPMTATRRQQGGRAATPPPPPTQGASGNSTRTLPSRMPRCKLPCTNCQSARKRCDVGRPCNTCIKRGVADTCVTATKRQKVPRRPSRDTIAPHFVAQNGAGTSTIDQGIGRAAAPSINIPGAVGLPPRILGSVYEMDAYGPHHFSTGTGSIRNAGGLHPDPVLWPFPASQAISPDGESGNVNDGRGLYLEPRGAVHMTGFAPY